MDEINEKKKEEVIDGLKNIGNSVLGYFGMSLDNFKLEQGANGGYNISFKQWTYLMYFKKNPSLMNILDYIVKYESFWFDRIKEDREAARAGSFEELLRNS